MKTTNTPARLQWQEPRGYDTEAFWAALDAAVRGPDAPASDSATNSAPVAFQYAQRRPVSLPAQPLTESKS